MYTLSYLGLLLFALGSIACLDYRYRLAFFADPRTAIKTVASGVLVFLVWDVVGVSLGIFFPGKNTITTGIMILPKIPLEELFFLVLLCYFTLVLWKVVARWQDT